MYICIYIYIFIYICIYVYMYTWYDVWYLSWKMASCKAALANKLFLEPKSWYVSLTRHQNWCYWCYLPDILGKWPMIFPACHLWHRRLQTSRKKNHLIPYPLGTRLHSKLENQHVSLINPLEMGHFQVRKVSVTSRGGIPYPIPW